MLISEIELELIPKCKTLSVPCKCATCENTFYITKTDAKRGLRGTRKNKFCSKECHSKAQFTQVLVTCLKCNTEFYKRRSEIRKTPNHFCNKSCAASYNNTHKTHGTRRSKLEVYVETHLPRLFPNLDFQFNRKTIIGSELDIYVPKLKLAFELNGPTHYRAVYGEQKFKSIVKNDKKKSTTCKELGISLHIVDVSQLSYYNETNAEPYLSLISDVVSKHLV
jgi:very-short-patch-repair endonuclease